MKKQVVLFLISLFLVKSVIAGEESKLTLKSQDGKYSLTFNSEIGARAEYKRTQKNDFSLGLTRSTLKFSGNFFDESLTYALKTGNLHSIKLIQQEHSPGSAPKSPEASLLSKAYIDWAFYHSSAVRLGRVDSPFSREDLSIFNHLNPSLVVDQFTAGIKKSNGILFHNGDKNMLEYSGGIFNEGVGLRLGYNFGAVDGYKYTDKTGGDLRFGIGLGGYSLFKYTDFKFNDHRVTLDAIVKFRHLTVDAAGYYQYNKPSEAAKAQNILGGQAGVGYLINSMFEPVVRYSIYKPEKIIEHEIYGGINTYCFDDHVKLTGFGSTKLSGTAKMKEFITGLDLYFAI